MFDFLFKRLARNKIVVPVQTAQVVSNVKAAQEVAKQAALTQAGALKDRESEAVEFILQCVFADARLKAAEHIHSKALQERVLQAMRNTDRRVSRLMQSRIDAGVRLALCEQQAMQCIENARLLLQDVKLTPNQVVDLDRAWVTIAMPPASLQQEFESLRTALGERLVAQAVLQRAVMDVLVKLRSMVSESSVLPPSEMADMLDAMEAEVAQFSAATETPSLPKHLLQEFAQESQSFRARLDALKQRHEAIVARQDALAQWEAQEPLSLKKEKLQQLWRALPGNSQDILPGDLNARFESLLRQTAVPATINEPAPVVEKKLTGQALKRDFINVLEQMEAALESGLLQVAAECDKTLRTIDVKAVQASESQMARLSRVRAELAHLLGWAKWGGNVSREELVKAAAELPAQQLQVSELAKKVGGLRERWKSLDVSAGPAAKELWVRFDLACTTAYAPAAEHFQQLAEERRQNSLKAQSMIAEFRLFATKSLLAVAGATAVDWKAVAQFCQNQHQAWQRLGTIERKEKKQLDAEFAQVMHALADPLEHQRKIEIKRRERLIAEAEEIRPDDRAALDALRGLQERWQECAKSLPLDRRDEQALWLRFRSACDAIFARRKEVAQAADVDRHAQLQAKETVCAMLEATAEEPDDVIRKILRESQEAWGRIGYVPRASEQAIEARYVSAVAALELRLGSAKRFARAAQLHALSEKMRLCHGLEGALVHSQVVDTSYLEQWAALPRLPDDIEAALEKRLSDVQAAFLANDRSYAAMLTANRTQLSQEILRLEIVAGLDSPAELSRERLKMQVEVLQSSLKMGHKSLSQDEQLYALCTLAALVDAQDSSRITQLLAQMAATKA